MEKEPAFGQPTDINPTTLMLSPEDNGNSCICEAPETSIKDAKTVNQ